MSARLTMAVLTVVGVVLAGGPVVAEPMTDVGQSMPQTVPALRNRVSDGVGFTLGEQAAVRYADERLRDTATGLATDLQAVTGKAVVARDGSVSEPGDIVLRIGAVGDAPNTVEAYRISAGPVLELQGADVAGVFYASQSALQLLRTSTTIPGGTVTDWPEYRERSLMLDVGREFMPVELLRAQIRRMGHLELNLLHLHLSETFGFRLESERHPEITAPQHYSKQDIRDLVEYAARYQVEIVPEVDFPGHMNGILAGHPELKLRSAEGKVSDTAIDISDPRSYDLMRDIVEEYLPLFPAATGISVVTNTCCKTDRWPATTSTRSSAPTRERPTARRLSPPTHFSV